MPLATRQVRAALRDRRIESPHGGHEVCGRRDFKCGPELVVGGVGLSVSEVAGDGPAEQVRPLGNEADAVPQDVGIKFADVDAADEHGASCDIDEAGDQAHEGRLAGSGAADDGRGLARADLEGDSFENGGVGSWVPEADLTELEGPGGSELGHGIRRRSDRRLGVEHLLYPFRTDRCPRGHDAHERRHHHRNQNQGEVGEEGDEGTDRHLSMSDPVCAEPDDGGVRTVDDEHDDWEHERHKATRPQ